MARQAVAVQAVPLAGLIDPTQNAAHADGHAVPNNGGRTVIIVENQNGASDVTLTATPTDDREGLAREGRDYVIGDGEKCIIAKLSSDIFEQKSGADKGKVYLDFAGGDTLTNVTIEAFVID